MGAQLRVVLDQLGEFVGRAEAEAAAALAAGLVATAPAGCTVSAIAPAGSTVEIAGIGEVRMLRRSPGALASAWRWGRAAGAGRGLIHAPSLMAPLVKHDRMHDNDQTVVTLWDLRAWEHPELLPAAQRRWQQAMLRRAVRFADAVVVPSHAMAARLGEIAALSDRIRVIAGAPPERFSATGDAEHHRAKLRLPEEYVVLTAGGESLALGLRAAAAHEVSVVVLEAAVGSEVELAAEAEAAGLPAARLFARGDLPTSERAAVLSGARALWACDSATRWPWRVVEAMALGVPVVATASDVHRDVIADGGMLVAEGEFAEAAGEALGSGGGRLRVLGADRARAFSWASSAERVWALHADL